MQPSPSDRTRSDTKLDPTRHAGGSRVDLHSGNASKRAKETVEALQPGRVDPQLTIRSDRRPEESPRLSAGRSRPADIEEDEDDLILIDDIYTSKLSPEAKARLKAKQKMLDQIRQGILNDPQESANLLRSWLAADSLKEEPAEAAA
jgi:hypothetical protein